jgi:hypothetical protein
MFHQKLKRLRIKPVQILHQLGAILLLLYVFDYVLSGSGRLHRLFFLLLRVEFVQKLGQGVASVPSSNILSQLLIRLRNVFVIEFVCLSALICRVFSVDRHLRINYAEFSAQFGLITFKRVRPVVFVLVIFVCQLFIKLQEHLIRLGQNLTGLLVKQALALLLLSLHQTVILDAYFADQLRNEFRVQHVPAEHVFVLTLKDQWAGLFLAEYRLDQEHPYFFESEPALFQLREGTLKHPKDVQIRAWHRREIKQSQPTLIDAGGHLLT